MLSRWQTALHVGCLRYHHCLGFLLVSHLGWPVMSQRWLASPSLPAHSPSTDKRHNADYIPSYRQHNQHPLYIQYSLAQILCSNLFTRLTKGRCFVYCYTVSLMIRCTFESVASTKVPSLWITGCWMLTSIPWSSKLDLHAVQRTIKTTLQNRWKLKEGANLTAQTQCLSAGLTWIHLSLYRR